MPKALKSAHRSETNLSLYNVVFFFTLYTAILHKFVFAGLKLKKMPEMYE